MNVQRTASHFSLLLLLLHSQSSLAFTCADSGYVTLDEKFEHYDFALAGKVEKKLFDLRIGTNQYLVTVRSVKKGEISTDQLVVWTYSGRCGANLKKGEEIVLFLKEDAGKMWANYFSFWSIDERTQERTREFEEYALRAR